MSDIARSVRLPKELRSFAIKRGGIVFFNARSALELLAWLDAEQIPILGVDGFFLAQQSTQPSMDYSIDLSDSENAAVEAKRHIEKLSDQPLFFEVVAEADFQMEKYDGRSLHL